MKQLFATAAVLLLACSAQAQIQKGNWVLSTTFSLTSEVRTIQQPSGNSLRYQNTEFTPQLQVGRFVKDRLAVGVQANYRINSTANQLTAGVFMRNYWPISPRFATFLHTDLTYSPNAIGFGGRTKSLGFGTQLGFVYFTHKAFAVEAKADFLRLAGGYSWNAPGRFVRLETNATTFNPALELSLSWYLGPRTETEPTNEVNRPRISRGTRVWGGSFRTNTLSGVGQNSNSFSTLQGGPDYSVFVRDDVALGIGLDGGLTNLSSSSGGGGTVSWSVGLTPYVRNYRMLSESFGLFLQSSVGVRYTFSRIAEQRFWNADLGLRPGVHYFLGKRWAIEGTAGLVGFTYQNMRIDRTDLGSSGLTVPFQRTLRFSNELGLGNFSVGFKYFVR